MKLSNRSKDNKNTLGIAQKNRLKGKFHDEFTYNYKLVLRQLNKLKKNFQILLK